MTSTIVTHTTTYNLLDLPQQETVGSAVVIDRKYGADGTKLQEKVTTSGSSVLSRDYIGNLIYENGSLKKILFDGGYVDMTGSAPAYRFYLTDHLGSVRVVAAADGTVMQVNHYYPYGGLIIDPRHTISSTNASDSRYRFTGKELSEENGEYDFGARYLDPAPGRFNTLDPLAEKYYNLSPYAYCAGNPMSFVDENGEKIVFVNGLLAAGSNVGGAMYWGGEHSSFVQKAMSILHDYNTTFLNINYTESFSTTAKNIINAKNRIIAGYEYAKNNIESLTADLAEGESLKFVTHSMGAAFSEGMAHYLLEAGVKVEMLIHFSPYQARSFKTLGIRNDILSIDAQSFLDPVISLYQSGYIYGADYHYIDRNKSSLNTKHRYLIDHSDTWDHISTVINQFLQNN